MHQDEVGGGHHFISRNSPPSKTCTHQERSASAVDGFSQANQLGDSVWSENFMVIPDIALVVDLDQNIPVTVVEQPLEGLPKAALHPRLVAQPLILPEVEDAQDGCHP